MTNKLYQVVFAFSIATVLGAGAASAETVSKTVSFSGLDLLSQTGKMLFDKRIVAAAKEICGSPSQYLTEQRLIRSCRTEAIDNGRAQAKVVIAEASRNAATQLASVH